MKNDREIQHQLFVTHNPCILDYGLRVGNHRSFTKIGIYVGVKEDVVKALPEDVRFAFN